MDPDGEAFETVLDVVGLGYDVVELVREPSLANGGFGGLDLVLTAVRFVPNVGRVKLAGKAVGAVAKSDNISDAARSIEKASNIGITGQIDELAGSITRHGDEVNVRVDNIDGKIENPLSVINNLAEQARASGATQ